MLQPERCASRQHGGGDDEGAFWMFSAAITRDSCAWAYGLQSANSGTT
jgi:hypothetical protein